MLEEREEDFNFHFRDGGLVEANVFLEETLTDEDFNDAQIDGSIVLGILHGTNRVWKIGEMPDKERTTYYIVRGEETPIETLKEIWFGDETIPAGTTLEGEHLGEFIMRKLNINDRTLEIE